MEVSKSPLPKFEKQIEMEWESEMRGVLKTQACGLVQTTAMLPLHWKSGWSPATIKSLLHEAVQGVVPGKVPQLQFSVPGHIVWQDFEPTATDRSYDATLEKVFMGPPVTQERILAHKCFIFVTIWSVQRAALYESHREALFHARFTHKSMEQMKNSCTLVQLDKAIDDLVEEEL
ncbi:hypothetical protein PG993_000136 [Apiospora rasikravindrae]|uniref:Uncharacterized protein n=1 Tax=Apiospora rasikravindrae TaxID=990691 RepID=A0ABR1U7Q6_9PEZI